GKSKRTKQPAAASGNINKELQMGMMKQVGLAILEDIHLDGPATRKELWERNQVCSWEMFKRMMGKLTVDGVVHRVLANPPSTDPAVDQFALTEAGREVVQELLVK
ncbi:MAG: hypothetical protein VXY99_01710, partial [Pseudomonadota bacterium]|nr:hypothetical protein [Pseudomonadota bacterium]